MPVNYRQESGSLVTGADIGGAIQAGAIATYPPYTNPAAVPAEKRIAQLNPVDWYPDAILASDGTYLYGHTQAVPAQLIRYPIDSHVSDAVVTPAVGLSITFIATTSIPGLIFLHVETAGNSGDIYRSDNYGATATKVLELGSRNIDPPVSGARSPDVRWLTNRSFCEATVNGATVLLIGEYNIGTARTIGGANDAVCLYRSDDLGLTWTIAREWNTDGDASHNDVAQAGNYVRHIHCVRQSPYDGNIYIAFGDVGSVGGVANNVQAGFLQWDGIAAFASNALLSSYNAAGIRNLSGSQIYRAVDMLFETEGIYVYTDATNATNQPEYPCGLFRYGYDFTNPTHERIDKSILEVPSRAAFLGVRLPTGQQVWIDSTVANATAGAYLCSLYTTSADRTHAARNAVIRSKTGGVLLTPVSLTLAGDKIYPMVTQASLIGKTGTPVLQFDATLPWNGERPDTVSPVYYVDATGTDDGTTTDGILRGNRPGTDAFKTLQYAMTVSRVPHGGRIVLPSGTFSEVSINPVFLTTDADTTEHVNVSGAGRDLTVVGNSNATTAWLLGPVSGAVQQNWDFQDLRLTTFKTGSGISIILLSSYANTNPYYLRFIRAEIGKRRGDISATVSVDDGNTIICISIAHGTVAARPNIRMVDSGMVWKGATDQSNSDVLLFHNNAAGLPVLAMSATRSHFWGGALQHGGVGSTMKLVNCVFGGWIHATTGQVQILSSATVSPDLVGCRREAILPSTWVKDNAVGVTGAFQFKNCISNQPLDDVAYFDPLTCVYVPGGKVKDAYANDYSLIP